MRVFPLFLTLGQNCTECYVDAKMEMEYDKNALRRFCHERGIARLELFGSANTDRFHPESDIDLLCTLRSDRSCTLLQWADMKLRLEEIFGRAVDLVSRPAVERSKNPYRRASILSSSRTIYAEG